MIKLKPRRQTVHLQPPVRPSRIRRDPVPLETAKGSGKPSFWDPSQWETWTVVSGVIFFAVALTIITFGVSDFTSH